MEATDHRPLVSQLAEDLGWLEDYCRRSPDLGTYAGKLHLASALARNVLGPFLEGQSARPLHVAVVGGAGVGKSTVVNFLAGAVVAETNPQAGYTRHPTAFLPAGPPVAWPTSLGFLGPLNRLSGERPANLDEDVYQVRRLPTAAEGEHPLADFVIWDCPDMTTWAAAGYVGRLLEVAALADVIVYVASDERYNDEVPTQFLHLLVRAGKAVIVVLTKARESDAAALVNHFRSEVLGRLPRLPDGSLPAVPVVTLPQIPPAERADPAGAGGRYRAELLNPILMQCESPEQCRIRTVGNALRYLSTTAEGLQEVARCDLTEYEAWRAVVAAGRAEFEHRYRREFLSSEPFRRFDRFRDELMQLLELPGAGRMLTTFFWVCRLPYRWARDYFFRLVSRPETFLLAERTVLTAALTGWLDQLHAEALRRADQHSLWKQVAARFDAELAPRARDRFHDDLRGLELKETEELEEAGRALVETLAGNPALLYPLRGAKFVIDLAIVGGVVYATWPPGWSLLLIPLGVSTSHQMTEWCVGVAVEQARERVRRRREELICQNLSGPLAEWLAEWPAHSGSALDKLQQVLHRVPEVIRQLEDRVRTRVGQWPVANPVRPPAPVAAAQESP